ncbi:hypothetical protein [Mycobacteroides abscessus]|uniref:hypothetical protein n=1 Tax=Mycobacteroides abscessus TaxID=36809 RepID=UPI0009CC2F15|nr:hypothetical protein [Mycobacteroides abscessus]SLH38385.1 Uncharacterised protein [Mycobacteroides abscessus subsp. massiliense]
MTSLFGQSITAGIAGQILVLIFYAVAFALVALYLVVREVRRAFSRAQGGSIGAALMLMVNSGLFGWAELLLKRPHVEPDFELRAWTDWLPVIADKLLDGIPVLMAFLFFAGAVAVIQGWWVRKFQLSAPGMSLPIPTGVAPMSPQGI